MINRNIRYLYIIKVAKWFMLTVPILMLFYNQCGFTTAQSFELKAFYSIAIVIFEIPSGYWADRIGRRKTIIIGTLLGTLGFAIYSFFTGYWPFLIAEMVLGIGMSCISGADSALLYDTLKTLGKESDYVKYEGRNFSVGNFAEAIGGIAGGALAMISLRLPFILQTGIAFIAIPAAFLLIEPHRELRSRKTALKDLLAVLKYALIKNKGLRYNLIFSSIIGALTLTMAWIIQLYLLNIGFTEFKIGLTATALNMLVGFTTLYAYKINNNLSPSKTVWTTTLILTLSFLMAGIFQSTWMILVFALFYIARGIATPILKDYINQLTSSDIRATVLSVRSLIIRGCFAIIGPIFGWYTDSYSLSDAFILSGIVFTILTSSTIFLFLKSIKNESN